MIIHSALWCPHQFAICHHPQNIWRCCSLMTTWLLSYIVVRVGSWGEVAGRTLVLRHCGLFMFLMTWIAIETPPWWLWLAPTCAQRRRPKAEARSWTEEAIAEESVSGSGVCSGLGLSKLQPSTIILLLPPAVAKDCRLGNIAGVQLLCCAPTP